MDTPLHPALSETIIDVAKQALRESGAAGFCTPLPGTAPQAFFAVGTPESIQRLVPPAEIREQEDVDPELIEQMALGAYLSDAEADTQSAVAQWDDLPERERMRWRRISQAVSWTVAAHCADIVERHSKDDDDCAGAAIRAAYGI